MSYPLTYSQQPQVYTVLPHLGSEVLYIAIRGRELVRGDGVVGFGPERDGEGEFEYNSVYWHT